MKFFVGYHADDRPSRAPEANLGADRIAIAKKPCGSGCIDQRHGRGGRRVAVAEQPAAHQMQVHGIEVSRGDSANRYLWPGLRFSFTPDNRERVGEPWIERVIAGDCNRTNARKNSCTRKKRACEFMLCLEIRPHSEISRVSRRG